MDDYTDSVMTLSKALQQRDEARAQRDALMQRIEAMSQAHPAAPQGTQQGEG